MQMEFLHGLPGLHHYIFEEHRLPLETHETITDSPATSLNDAPTE